MANAKNLTPAQITMLRWFAQELWGRPRPKQAGTFLALQRRGLVSVAPATFMRNQSQVLHQITPAGRQALFEATGESPAPKEIPCPP